LNWDLKKKKREVKRAMGLKDGHEFGSEG